MKANMLITTVLIPTMVQAAIQEQASGGANLTIPGDETKLGSPLTVRYDSEDRIRQIQFVTAGDIYKEFPTYDSVMTLSLCM
jgi:hypothetical protein